jgi:hypothetical protein
MAIALGGPAMANDQVDTTGPNHNQTHAHQNSRSHQGHMPDQASEQKTPTLVGQYAFATLAEIVSLLEADPDTNWSKVDIESLREHLIDMDRVTLSSIVVSSPIDEGMRFTVTGVDPSTIASIQRMTQAHAAAQSAAVSHGGAETNVPSALHYAVQLIENGAEMSVTARDEDEIPRIRALGFIGVMVSGMHHQAHHWAMAKGENPHDH